MNEKLTEIYRLCRPKEALKSQEIYQSANVLMGSEVEKFAELIIQECMRMCDCADVSLLEHNCTKEASGAASAKQFIKEWFEVEE